MFNLLLLAGMFLITFSLRFFFLGGRQRADFPQWLRTMLEFVPPAVLTAIVVPAVLFSDDTGLNFQWSNAYLFGALAAILTSYISKNLLLTLIVSFSVFALWKFVLFI
jgi:branched-subunit amino acid transport protein